MNPTAILKSRPMTAVLVIAIAVVVLMIAYAPLTIAPGPNSSIKDVAVERDGILYYGAKVTITTNADDEPTEVGPESTLIMSTTLAFAETTKTPTVAYWTYEIDSIGYYLVINGVQKVSSSAHTIYFDDDGIFSLDDAEYANSPLIAGGSLANPIIGNEYVVPRPSNSALYTFKMSDVDIKDGDSIEIYTSIASTTHYMDTALGFYVSVAKTEVVSVGLAPYHVTVAGAGDGGGDAGDTAGNAKWAFTILDAASTHAAIKGATISLNDGQFTGTTDANGYYLFYELPAGDYVATISATGYLDTTKEKTLTDTSSATSTLYLAADTTDDGTGDDGTGDGGTTTEFQVSNSVIFIIAIGFVASIALFYFAPIPANIKLILVIIILAATIYGAWLAGVGVLVLL